jgi:hypothetical protein
MIPLFELIHNQSIKLFSHFKTTLQKHFKIGYSNAAGGYSKESGFMNLSVLNTKFA